MWLIAWPPWVAWTLFPNIGSIMLIRILIIIVVIPLSIVRCIILSWVLYTLFVIHEHSWCLQTRKSYIWFLIRVLLLLLIRCIFRTFLHEHILILSLLIIILIWVIILRISILQLIPLLFTYLHLLILLLILYTIWILIILLHAIISAFYIQKQATVIKSSHAIA